MTAPDRLSLTGPPTLFQPLPRMAEKLGMKSLWIKRDDLTALAFGGNKLRKLEFLLADALQMQADCIVTAGAIQSNHCRQTAIASSLLGLPCHLVLGGSEPDDLKGNLLLDKMVGATIHWCGPDRRGETAESLLAELKAAGKKPYFITYGGSDALGTLAYEHALGELQKQSQSLGLKIDRLIFASSSGGTQAGLQLGVTRRSLPWQVEGIRIDKADPMGESYPDLLARLAAEAAERMGWDNLPPAQDFLVNEDYLEAGYAVLTGAETRAIKLLARTEGIFLDPVYTGRAFAALIDRAETDETIRNETVVFWHTGGAPALFAYPPAELLA